MPWTGRLYKLTTVGYMNLTAAIDTLYLHWEVLYLFLWISLAPDWHGSLERGVQLGHEGIGTGLTTLASRSIPSGPWEAHIACVSVHRYIEAPRYPKMHRQPARQA